MTITTRFIIICREAFLTAGSNNLNLIGIFTQINADKFPFAYPHFAVVVNFDIDTPGEHTLAADVMDPAGKQVAHTELPVRTNAGNWQVIANFEQMKFMLPGAYTFNLALDGHALGTRTLSVAPVLTPGRHTANIA